MLLQVLEARQKTSASSSNGSSDGDEADEDAPRQSAHLHGQVDIAALVRHELSPAVGWIRLAADSEIPSFATSKTNQAVRKLQRRIDGLVAMIKAGEPLNPRRLSLPHVLIDNWPDEHSRPLVTPTAEEQRIDIETDEGLFSLLLSNIFQNAIDASVVATGAAQAHITWGYTGHDYWVRVANPFSGDRLTLKDVVHVGSSSKMAHQGQGLALIEAVSLRLGITIALEGASGTASFTFTGKRP
ncbi:ATP-binding protein [Mycobacterium asiaticum]|uniref:ATP-binding protein n=1 Tax=Mycobacterium asiaticum TaxID=1790 RepID=UPI0012DB0DFC|nr:ATP-binding protein [Mycobacterium asiaticum]